MERIPGFLASAYNKAAKMAIGSYYSQVADEVVSELKSGIVLDLGTGPGYLPIEIVKRALGIRVIGVDLTPKLIGIAQQNSVKAGVAEKVYFEVMNAVELRFEDNYYDMVLSTGMLHAFRKLDKASKLMRECYRVLKPGGQAWIYDPAKVCSGIDTKLWKASLTYWERLLFKIFGYYEILNPPHHYDQREFAQIIASTGFNVYSVEEQEGEIRVKLRKA